ncbi:hypothetical protein MMC26_006029 [Xylographa opegraphella]|nr:hypothetical protein [Xylographa opegraphella]
MFASKRLGKELAKIQSSLPPGIALVSAPDLSEWHMDIKVLDPNPIYLNLTFRLRFRFTNNYPIEAPEVVFVTTTDPPRPIPMHPHIYSNGIICLDLLGSAGWSPVQNVESICMSIQSMLTGNTKNERPVGDEDVVRSRQGPKNMRFSYDDLTV